MSPNHSKAEPVIRILLVEDDQRDIELMQAALADQMTCHVRVALTKDSFVAELDREIPNIIVSDSNVLAFDGLTALKIASHKCPDVPFVFCSGNASEAKKAEAFAEGATGWVTKDDRFAQLVLVVKRLCGSQKP
jgi:CheY-like chemotaxis protein